MTNTIEIIKHKLTTLKAESEEWNEAVHMIDNLSNEQRREIRQHLEISEIPEIPRNLCYNYNTQEWI